MFTDVIVRPSEDQCFWDCYLNGPEQTPYEEGWFYFTLTFPPGYPYKPPKRHVETKIYHPVLTKYCNMCSTLRCLGDQWAPAITGIKVLLVIFEQLKNPMGNRECDFAKETWEVYDDDYEAYCMIAKQWTREFALNRPPIPVQPQSTYLEQ